MTQHRLLYLFPIILILIGCAAAEDEEEVKYNTDLKDGTKTIFYEDGSIHQTFELKDSLKHGFGIEYYKNGQVYNKATYVEGLKQDTAYVYYKGGKVSRKTPYRDDEKHGIQRGYSKEGELLYEMPYSNGTPLPGLKMYDVDGTVMPEPKLVFERKPGGGYIVDTDPHHRKTQYYEVDDYGGSGKFRYRSTARIQSTKGKCEIGSRRAVGAKYYADYKTVYILFGKP